MPKRATNKSMCWSVPFLNESRKIRLLAAAAAAASAYVKTNIPFSEHSISSENG